MRKLPNPPLLLHLGRLWSVAVYRLSQHYGGPEEGGWSYSAGPLVGVVRYFGSEAEALTYMRRANRLIEYRRRKYRLWGQEELRYMVRQGKAESWYPSKRPHYE